MSIYAPPTTIQTNRDNNGSSIVEGTAKIVTGWKAWQPGAVAASSQAITFPVTFTNVPVVVVSFGGDTTTTTSTLGSGGANHNNAYAEAISLTTSGFTARVAGASASWLAGETVYVQWIAIGI